MWLLKKLLNRFKVKPSCCGIKNNVVAENLKKIAILGSPNVGKSVLFNTLTKRYVTVSNYPGTTVTVSQGKTKIGNEEFKVIDTPGMYSLLPITEEERVTRSILLRECPEIVIHVIDAKNLERMLALTFQLIEAELPVILVLNIIDEAEEIGMEINIHRLETELGIPVVATVSTTGRGMDTLKEKIEEYVRRKVKKIGYEGWEEFSIEIALERIENLLKKDYRISKRAIGLLLLQEDEEIQNLVKEREPGAFREIASIVSRAKTHYSHPLDYVITMRRQEEINQIVKRAVGPLKKKKISFRERLSRTMMNPITGIPVLLIVLFLGLYQFVGVFAAQTIVDFLEITLFEERISPWVRGVFSNLSPSPLIQDLFVGEYGILTQAVPYAVALILPIVTAFSLVFSIIEDTGYLPRLAMLIDRLFKKIGLSGRAVIPMTLGFGCDTMAVMVTRTLETKREKVISSLLLALAIPCSAQLGIIFALLSGRPKALLIWGGVVALEFLFIGYLASKVMPGRRSSFFMEVPPLRRPKLSNVLKKTYSRVQWYFMEVFPLFVLASILIWLGQLTGLFQLTIKTLEPLVRLIGLPDETAVAFLFGFFRRDYGAAGLLDMNREGIFSGVQLVVAAVTLTLFIPCIAQFIMTVKERGIKTAILMALFIFPSAFLVGFFVNLILTALGVQL